MRNWKAVVTVMLSDQPDAATDAELHKAVMEHIVETHALSPADGETELAGITLEEITNG